MDGLGFLYLITSQEKVHFLKEIYNTRYVDYKNRINNCYYEAYFKKSEISWKWNVYIHQQLQNIFKKQQIQNQKNIERLIQIGL